MRLAAAAAAIIDTPEGTPVKRSILLAASAMLNVPPVFPGGIVTTGQPCLNYLKASDLIEYVPVEEWNAPNKTLVMAAYSVGAKSVFGPIVPEYWDGQPYPDIPAGYTIPETDPIVDGREGRPWRDHDEVRVVGPVVGLSRLVDRGTSRQGLYDAGGLRFGDYTEFDGDGDGEHINDRALLSSRSDERNEPAVRGDSSADTDLDAILNLTPGSVYSCVLLNSFTLYPCDDPLFTTILTAFRFEGGRWWLQLFEHQGSSSLRSRGGKGSFEFYGTDDAENDGGWVQWADDPEEVADLLAEARAMVEIHRLGLRGNIRSDGTGCEEGGAPEA